MTDKRAKLAEIEALVDAVRGRANGAAGRPFPTLPHQAEPLKELPHSPPAAPALPASPAVSGADGEEGA